MPSPAPRHALRAFAPLACALAATLMGCGWRDRQVVAEAGACRISRSDARLRDEVIAVYYPNERRHLGMHQLIEACVSAEILKNHGHPITDDQLRAEERRIQDSTKAPESLARIRAVFNGDEKSYLKDYVFPVYVDRTLYSVFLNDPVIQARSFARARSLLARALSNPREALTALANGETSGVSRFKVSRSSGFRPAGRDATEKSPDPEGLPAPLREMRERQRLEDARRWLDEFLKSLKPGQIYPKVVNAGESWQLARLLKRQSADEAEIELLTVPKEDFGAWLEAEKARVPVKILDDSLPR